MINNNDLNIYGEGYIRDHTDIACILVNPKLLTQTFRQPLAC